MSAAAKPKKTQSKKNAPAAIGQSSSSTSSILTPSAARLKDLYAANAFVQQLRNENDLLERLIMDKDGTDLRAVVAKCGELVRHSATEYNLLHDRMQQAMEKRREGTLSSFVHQKLSHDDISVLNHMFEILLKDNPNDDKARVGQLAVVFVALTIEIDVRANLTAQPKHVDRFSAGESSTTTAEQQRIERSNLIQKDPLTLFLMNDARELRTKLFSGMLDLRGYVSSCVAQYMAYKPSVCVRVAQEYYGEK